MNKIKKLKILEEYQIALSFQDGLEGVVNLRPFLEKGFAKELLSVSEFRKVEIETGGGLS